MSEQSHHRVETDSFSLDGLPLQIGEAGLKLTTRRSLSYHDLPKGELGLTEDELWAYRDALRREGDFHGVGDYKAVLEANKAAADAGDEAAKQAIADAWKVYREGSTSSLKVGIRNIGFDSEAGETVVDVLPVPFHAYRLFSRENASEALLDRVEATGVAMAVITADGRLVVQHRAIGISHMLHDDGGKPRNNATYADIPGASAAGMLDANRGEVPGTIAPIGNAEATRGVGKESIEELGIHTEAEVIGIAHDKQKPHHEIILFEKIPLTATELYAKSREESRNRKLAEFDFEERFFDIPATPEAIMKLVSEVKCPLPPTHAATFVATGYTLVLQEKGVEAAQQWKADVEQAINKNVREIDATVKHYYEQYPDAKDIVPERYWGTHVPPRNLNGYSANYGPEEQGLPKLEDELVRVGLVEEKREVVNHIYSIDLDGVITDPQKKKVIHPELFDEIIARLRRKEPVALNTGRSTKWALENVAKAIQERVEDPADLKYLMVIGEKGNTWATFNELGEVHHGKAGKVTIDDDLQIQIKGLTAKYRGIMGNHDPKTTMASVEMNDGMDIAEYTRLREPFIKELKELVESHPEGKGLSVDATTIAVDVENPHAGKALGAARFLRALDEMNIAYNGARFTALGDSPSDFDMAEELARHGLRGEFIFVGDTMPAQKKGYETVEAHHFSGYSSGTLEYFKSHRLV